PIDRIGIGVPYKDKSNIARRGHSQDRRCAGNVWFLPYQTVHSKSQKFNHPAGFPEALPARCIAMHGGADLRVLDPFMGTGTTLIAAKNGGHSGIGIEIDPVYVETALQRLGAD
ncbi:MAG: site-specific DNA-methyltransferase, partial [Pseudomonadota bacterium]